MLASLKTERDLALRGPARKPNNLRSRNRMGRLTLIATALALLLSGLLSPPLQSAPTDQKNESVLVVLLPLKVTGVDKDMLIPMENALKKGLQEKYTVFSGDQVAQKRREIYAKESEVTPIGKDCDATRCLQRIAEVFQAELIALANVTQRRDGYFLSLSIQNVFDGKDVFTETVGCDHCNEPQVVAQLKTLAGSGFTGELEAGVKAYDAKEYSNALGYFKPLAERGNVEAQGYLGVMYANGQGLEKNLTEAVKWFRLAAGTQIQFGSLVGKIVL